MGAPITDPVLGTLMNTTNKYQVWNKGSITTKVRIADAPKKKKNKKKEGK